MRSNAATTILVTVAALGISAVSIARAGAASNLNTVVYQFGIGLFARLKAAYRRRLT